MEHTTETSIPPLQLFSTDKLKDKLANYPLIQRLYLPIIEAHSKKYPGFDIEDWLIIPYFQLAWFLEGKHHENHTLQLNNIEANLNKIYHALGIEEFDKLCADFLIHAMHPTIDGVFNHILSFYGELKCMLYFIDLGYQIKRIPRKEHATADFYIVKGHQVDIVECKFIHAPNSIQKFINRYISYIKHTLPLEIKDIFEGCTINIADNKMSLTQQDILEIKSFIDLVLLNKDRKSYKLQTDRYVISYRIFPTGGFYAFNLNDFFTLLELELNTFYKEYVKRRVEQATNKQLNVSALPDLKKYVYIFIELDYAYSAPFHELDQIRNYVHNYFLNTHKLDVIPIIETFPPVI